MHISKVILALAAATLLATGCAKQRGPATDALKAVETSLSQVKDDAAKYAPDGLKGVESQLARLQESLDKKEYDNVLAGTPQLSKAVDSLKDAVTAGKAEAKAAVDAAKTEWAALSTDVPKMVEAIQSRVDTLSKSKRLPFGINKDEFEGAKSGLEMMKTTWAEATADEKSGKQVEATNKAKTVKGMGEEVLDKLNMKKA
jgi:hypothetical protein